MTPISVTKGTADVVREITTELEQMNELKEAELRLKYGDEAYFDIPCLCQYQHLLQHIFYCTIHRYFLQQNLV